VTLPERMWPPQNGPAGVISRRALLLASAGALPAALARGRGAASAQDVSMATPHALGPALPPELTDYAMDWPAPHGSLVAHRAAADSPITAANVGQLAVAWRFPIAAAGAYGAVTAVPLVVGDTIYLQDTLSNVFALERESGAVRWRHDYTSITAGPNGVAVGYGMIFGALGLDPSAFALDAATGKEVWRVKLSANPNEFIFMQPIVYDNVVYMATSPGAYIGGTRGVLFALDAQSGSVLWQWDTTTDNLWGSARLNAGGGLWYPPSIDEEGNIYFGTGNPAPWPEFATAEDAGTRPGPDLYSSAMVSLDTTAGSSRWYVQAAPHDQLDHDFQLTPVLASVAVDGQPMGLAIGSGKTGLVIAANAETGKEVWRASVGQHNAYGDGAELPLPSATPVTIAPGAFGGVLSPLAFAGETVYVPVINLPLTYTDTSSDMDLAAASGQMIALRASDGTVLWQTTVDTFFDGGATVANDVVFGSGLDGIVRGFATATGEEIWRYQAGAGINAPPAIAGDLLLVPAGGPFLPTTQTPPLAQNELIAFRLSSGAGSTATAVTAATPAP
jgi:glucose dehydrogenase